MARQIHQLGHVDDLQQLVAQLNDILKNITNEFSTIQGSNGATFTNTSTKIGLYGASPVTQASVITDPSGGSTVDAEARTAITSINTALKNLGITASS